MWRAASEEAYLDFADWKKNESDFDITDSKTYVGLDLSRAEDLTAVSFIHLDEKNREYYVTSHSFVGTKGGLQSKIERDMIDYQLMSDHGYCSITDLKSGIINPTQVLNYIENYTNLYLEKGFIAIKLLWESYSNTIGRHIRVTMINEVAEGEAIGITADGMLQLKQHDGTVRNIYSGDITIQS